MRDVPRILRRYGAAKWLPTRLPLVQILGSEGPALPDMQGLLLHSDAFEVRNTSEKVHSDLFDAKGYVTKLHLRQTRREERNNSEPQPSAFREGVYRSFGKAVAQKGNLREQI